MNDSERTIQQMLAEGGRFDPARADQIRQEIAETYDRRLTFWKVVVWAMLALDAAGMVGLAVLFALTGSIKAQIACAAGFVFIFESSVMEKMFYWYLSVRYRLQKDLVELKLQVAALSAAQSSDGPDSRSHRPAPPAGGVEGV